MYRVRILALVVVVIVAVWYILAHRDDFNLLQTLNRWYLIPMAFATLVSILLNGQILKYLVARFGVLLTWGEGYALTALHSFGNYLPVPQAGSVTRGFYLKRAHELPYTSFAAVVAVTFVRFLLAVGVLGLVVGIGLAVGGSRLSAPLWFVFATLLATPLVLRPGIWSRRPFSRFERIRNDLEVLRAPGVAAQLAVTQILLLTVTSIGLWLSFQALGQPVGFAASLLVTLIAMASGVFNVTPGNLGIAEAAAWSTARLIGADADIAVVAFTLLRIVSATVIFAHAPVVIPRLASRVGGTGSLDRPDRLV